MEQLQDEAKVTRYEDGFVITPKKHQPFRAKKVIVATGIEDHQPELENLLELRNLGLLRYCSICDGYEYRNHPVAVIARDEFGIQKALFVRNWTKNLRVILPESFQPGPRHIHELRERGIKLHHVKTLRILPSQHPKGMELYLDDKRPLFVRATYVELGCSVKSSAFESLKKLSRTKEGILIATTEQRTSIPGLFAVGDCVNLLGQLAVASGQAAVAATTIHNDLLA